MIILRDISKVYETKGRQVNALDKINITINKGDFIAIVGKSGCGKSTLLNCMSGLTKLSSGEIIYNDNNISKLNSSKLLNFRKENIGIILQNFSLLNDRTVFQNVELPLKIRKISKHKRKEEVINSLSRLGLDNMLNAYPNELSGGEKQRVAIARALIYRPQVLLADEPTGALDEFNTSQIIELLKNISDKGTSVIMVTHNLSAAKLCNKEIKMEDGKIVSTKEIRQGDLIEDKKI